MGRFAGPSGTVVIGHREPLAGTKQYSAHGYPGTVRFVGVRKEFSILNR